MFRLRRNLPAAARALSLPLTICQAYYLGTYKYLDAYRILKAICMDERYQQGDGTGEDALDACEICGDGGNLIICDACELEYHIDCVQPALQQVPEGRWECDACVDQGFLLHVRNANVEKYTQLFEPGKTESTYKPTVWALEMAESFVVGIQHALHGQEGKEEATGKDPAVSVAVTPSEPVANDTGGTGTELEVTKEDQSESNKEGSTNALETKTAAMDTD